MLTVFFFHEGHPRKSNLSLNIKISDNDHQVNIYCTPRESSLNFSTLLLKTTCVKLLLWKTRTTVRLVWLSICFSKVHNYVALFLLFLTEETGEEYLLKQNRIIKLILCKQLALYGMKVLGQFFKPNFVLLFNTTVAFRAGSHQSKLIGFFF